MIGCFEDFFSTTRVAFSCAKVFDKGKQLAYGLINCQGRSTLTGLITGIGKQFVDWSAYYRIFSKNRIDVKRVFNLIFLKGVELAPVSDYVVVHMDDTIVRKTGKKIPGSGWRRDPLGPPFNVNLVWGQRYLELSLAVADQQGVTTLQKIFKHPDRLIWRKSCKYC